MMLRHARIVLATASIVLLSSCALPTSVLPQSASGDPQPSGTAQSQGSDSGDSGTDAKTTDAGKQDSFASRTVGEALEIGKFSPEQHSQPAFNPCREVTEEQWKSLGLQVNRVDDGTTESSTICSLKVIPEQTEPAQSTIITGNFNPLSEELEKGERLNNVKINKPSYVYLYSSNKPYRDICSAGTVTNQGRVAVSYGEFSNKVAPPSAEKTCQKAVDVLEGIFNLPVLPRPSKHPQRRRPRRRRQAYLARNPQSPPIRLRQAKRSGKSLGWASSTMMRRFTKHSTRARKSRRSSGSH